MTKKHFIALADTIKHSESAGIHFTAAHLEMLASFCIKQNSAFNRRRWLSYIAGECGKDGGKS